MSRAPQVGVAIIITRGDQVLLVRRKGAHGAGTWATPGGHLEFGESPEECAVREAQEETGLHIAGVWFRAITNDVFAAERKHYITIWMEARPCGGEAVINAADEVAEVGWFRWDALPRPLFLPLQNLIEGRCYPCGESEQCMHRM